MNISFINSTKRWGGGEKWHLENAIQLSKHAFNVYIATNKGSDLEKRAIQQQIPTFSIPTGNLSFINPLKLYRFVRFFKKQNIDAVILNGPNDIKLAGRAAKIAGVKKIIYRRGNGAPIKPSPFNKYLLSKICTDIIANSNETHKSIINNFKHTLPLSKVKVLYNGFDFKEFENYTSKPLKSNSKIILGTAGRLSEEKGHKYLIEMAIKLKQQEYDFEIRIAGEGNLRIELEKLIFENNLSNYVILFGFQSNIKQFMEQLDIFILPSLWEGFGFVLVEAMALKIPVIAFNIGSIPEIVTHNDSGYLSDLHDVETMTGNVIKLIKSEELRNQFGKNGFNHVMEKFNIENATQQLISLLKTN